MDPNATYDPGPSTSLVFYDSSSSDSEADIERRLDNFRENWRTELKQRTKSTHRSNQRTGDTQKENNNPQESKANAQEQIAEANARAYFKQAVELEKRGKYFDAVAFYRRATQLVPDIEYRMYQRQLSRRPAESNEPSHQAAVNNNELPDQVEEGDAKQEDLVEKFSELVFDEDWRWIPQETEQPERSHIGALPYELIQYLFRWIVSTDLDILSLERMSEVCRGLYLAAQDPELWRSACLRSWGILGLDPERNLPIYGHCWRRMFIERARPNFGGCYISRTTYVRHGEASFQDFGYRPCQIVEYYRYLRFYPGGAVLMVTTPDDPFLTLPKIRNHKLGSRNGSNYFLTEGRYRILSDDETICAEFLKVQEDTEVTSRNKGRGKQVQRILTEKNFHVELKLRKVGKRRNHQLVWSRYWMDIKRSNGSELRSEFDLLRNLFPPFYFSRVKSFNEQSEAPLI